MKSFFTADWHYYHGNIMKYCNRVMFMTPDEAGILASGDRDAIRSLRISDESVGRMTAAFTSTINAQAEPDDKIYMLGDWIWRNADAKKLRDSLRCRNIYFIIGNHDRINIGLFSPLPEVDYDPPYTSVTVKVNGQAIALSHTAQAVWDMQHYGAWHLYGHSHGTVEKWLDEAMPGRYSMDVGIDNAFNLTGEYRMFEFDEIKKIFSTRPGFGVIRKPGEEWVYDRPRQVDT